MLVTTWSIIFVGRMIDKLGRAKKTKAPLRVLTFGGGGEEEQETSFLLCKKEGRRRGL